MDGELRFRDKLWVYPTVCVLLAYSRVQPYLKATLKPYKRYRNIKNFPQIKGYIDKL